MQNLVIGTANFNKLYGLNKTKVKLNEIKSILKKLKKRKIFYIDTADNYKLSKKIKNLIRINKFKIIFKFNLPRKKVFSINTFCKNLAKKLNQFSTKPVEAIMFHNVEDFENKNILKILNKIYDFKKRKLVKKIGISIYSPNDLQKIRKIFIPDLIQIPLNIFDQRFTSKKFVDFFKSNKIDVYARSIFLQGVILKTSSEINKLKFNDNIKKKLHDYDEWCKNNYISKIDASFKFIKKKRFVKYVVVGVDNFKQLNDLVLSFKSKKNFKLRNFSYNNNNLIDPRKW